MRSKLPGHKITFLRHNVFNHFFFSDTRLYGSQNIYDRSGFNHINTRVNYPEMCKC